MACCAGVHSTICWLKVCCIWRMSQLSMFILLFMVLGGQCNSSWLLVWIQSLRGINQHWTVAQIEMDGAAQCSGLCKKVGGRFVFNKKTLCLLLILNSSHLCTEIYKCFGFWYQIGCSLCFSYRSHTRSDWLFSSKDFPVLQYFPFLPLPIWEPAGVSLEAGSPFIVPITSQSSTHTLLLLCYTYYLENT